ncbi:hypothetical protein DSM112329_00413 [Paraconexibacter sp. AEG42_29]|uniref:Carboxypeptidase regulatory-like domain-containing protein n=1 Tax=Paraconexibacter sp. AEG42_29 TaxID=2997339 RepID=A0AAU7APJ0_9ACTN
MRARSRAIPPILAALVVVGVGGCGDSDDPVGTAGTGAGTVPATTRADDTPATETIPTAVFTFGPDGLTPAVARVKLGRGRVVDLEVVSLDGRPHGVVVDAGGTRTRVVVTPGAATGKLLRNVAPGRYRVIPDGAADPALMIVEK